MTQPLRLAYNDNGDTPRRSLSSLFNAVAAGRPPKQPHADGDLLIAEAFIAQETLRKIGAQIRDQLQGQFEVGPEKDLARAKAKTRERGDLALNCDFSRARVLLKDVPQIRKAIELFGKKGPVTLGKAGRAVDFHIVDVDNTFTHPSPKKPGLCNLDVKIAFPITLESGEESYHICEVQFLHKGTRATYDKSHKIYEQARSELIRRQFIENAMELAGCPETAKSLEKRWKKADRLYTELMQKREELNTGIAQKLGLNVLAESRDRPSWGDSPAHARP